MGFSVFNLCAYGVSDKTNIDSAADGRPNLSSKRVGMKQIILEFLAYVISSGLLVNLWLMQKLIQKISDFETINERLKKKFQALDKILNNLEE